MVLRLSAFSRPGDVPLLALACTPISVAAGFVLNTMWFAQFLKQLREQLVAVFLRGLLGLAVAGGSPETRIAVRLAREPEPKRPAAICVQDNEQLLKALVFRGDVGLGETFMQGVWTTSQHAEAAPGPENDHSLYQMLRASAGNYVKLQKKVAGFASVKVPNMRSAAARKQSIVEHYDDPTELFSAFLGSSMVYTAALWDLDSATDTLEAAQYRKIDRILDLAQAFPSSKPVKLMDLGCGWGTLVRRAAQERGIHANGITNSPSMAGTCTKERLSDRETYTLGDFLELPLLGEKEAYDYITCVEAIEAVRHSDYRRFAASVHRSLKEQGRAVFQIIHAYGAKNPTIRLKDFQEGGTFVQTYIFPGQQLPYLEYVYEEFSAEGLEAVYTESTGLHYAQTLRTWRQKLQIAESLRLQDGGKGFWDEKAFRKYQFYLAWCEAGFSEGLLDVSRVVFQKKTRSKIEIPTGDSVQNYSMEAERMGASAEEANRFIGA
jgi:cyclopropane-fatty-acyl-phospholipid synthase